MGNIILRRRSGERSSDDRPSVCVCRQFGYIPSIFRYRLDAWIEEGIIITALFFKTLFYHFVIMSRDERTSVRVCEVLDHLGYSQSMVQFRREAWRKNDVMANRKDPHKTGIIAGSKGEGFTRPRESDTDRTLLDNHAVCRIPGDDFRTFPDTHYKLVMDSEQCQPGHFKLELTHIVLTEDDYMTKALFNAKNGRTYVSSSKYEELKRKETESKKTTTEVKKVNQNWDHVHALRCTSQQQLLSQWLKRPRHHNWPTPDLIKEVSNLEAQVIPKETHWRVCFIPSEQRLTDSWNENQYKIYILLKLVNKSRLKPGYKKMSSFLLKNIMLWYTEQNPAKIFQKKNLLKNVMSCLEHLQEAIKANHLPYYMIPDRNLLIDKFSKTEQKQLIDKLGELLKEGPNMITKCQKVDAALTMFPPELARRGRWGDKVEHLFLELENLRMEFWEPGQTSEYVNKLANKNEDYISRRDKMLNLVWPQRNEKKGDDNEVELKRRLDNALL